jgi:hypothetical protein
VPRSNTGVSDGLLVRQHVGERVVGERWWQRVPRPDARAVIPKVLELIGSLK